MKRLSSVCVLFAGEPILTLDTSPTCAYRKQRISLATKVSTVASHDRAVGVTEEHQ